MFGRRRPQAPFEVGCIGDDVLDVSPAIDDVCPSVRLTGESTSICAGGPAGLEPTKEVVTLPRRPAPPLAVEIPHPAGIAKSDNYHFHEATEPGTGQV
eukprot:10115417-Alexandrium_andersonii.AAC.1